MAWRKNGAVDPGPRGVVGIVQPYAVLRAHGPACQVPLAPSNLAIVTPGVPGAVVISWTNPPSNYDGVGIWRHAAGDPYALLWRYPGAEPSSYVDIDVSPGVTYYYKLTAYNQCGDSAYSNEVFGVPEGGA